MSAGRLKAYSGADDSCRDQLINVMYGLFHFIVSSTLNAVDNRTLFHHDRGVLFSGFSI
jgi:hypothetical protein